MSANVPEQPRHPVLRVTIPPKIYDVVNLKKVIETSFGAGPAFIVGKVDRHKPGINFDQALEILEQYNRFPMRAGSMVFGDRSVLWFDRDKFSRYESKPAKELPRPGVTFPGHAMTLMYEATQGGLKAKTGRKKK